MRPDPIPETLAILAVAPITAVYHTRISTGRGVSNKWNARLPLEIGFSWPPESAAPVPMIRLNNEDYRLYAALTMELGDKLVVSLDLTAISEITCAANAGMYLKAQAVIDADGRSFTGTVSSTCADPTGDKPYAWTGSVETGEGIDWRLQKAAMSYILQSKGDLP